jgi:hypothetical protein
MTQYPHLKYNEEEGMSGPALSQVGQLDLACVLAEGQLDLACY